MSLSRRLPGAEANALATGAVGDCGASTAGTFE
jgi:hypothetical protein